MVEKRLHDTDGVGDEHTHTEVARLNGGELAQRVETRCRQRGSLLQERGEEYAPLKRIVTKWVRSSCAKLRGRVLWTSARRAWGYGGPGNPCGDTNPQCGYECDCPGVCGVEVCVHERGEMRAATHA